MKINSWKIVFYLLFFAQVLVANGQRIRYSINENWHFIRADVPYPTQSLFENSGRLVSFPHTWNVEDVMDDTPGYYRNIAWLKQQLIKEQPKRFVPHCFIEQFKLGETMAADNQ